MKQILSTRPAGYSSSSILISILYLIGVIDWSCDHIKKHSRSRGRPYVYSTTIILRCFIVRIWFRLDSNRSLHHFLSLDLPYNKKVVKACGLSAELFLPDRRTFDRRLKTVSDDIRERISTMGNLFVLQDLVKPYILAIDSTLLRSKGKVWHASSMKKGIVPCSGIDTDARWGFSHTRGWIFGYKLHMVSSTDSLNVPLAADVTTANIPDNQVYRELTSSSGLSPEIIKKVHFMVADPGYDDHDLYESSMQIRFQLVCPVRRYRKTPEERLKLIDFYESALGQVVYSRRRISIEPLIEHIKSVFRIDPVPVRGYDRVRSIVLLTVLLYRILVYYNFKIQKKTCNPRMIKYMIGC